MKKFFTLIVALVATVSAMAQSSSDYKFEGKSTYSASFMGQTITNGKEHDTITVSNAYKNITIPEMVVTAMGTQMTVPSITIPDLEYKLESGNPMNRTAVFTWEKDTMTFTATVDGKEKTVKIGHLSGKFAMETMTMDVSLYMQYGSMPMPLYFEEKGAAYVKTPTSISEVSAAKRKPSARKAIINGKVVVTNGDKLFTPAGAMVK